MITKHIELLTRSTFEITQNNRGDTVFRIQQEHNGKRHASTYTISQQELSHTPMVFEYALDRFLWQFEKIYGKY